MSRIGKKPIPLPAGVKIKVDAMPGPMHVEGPKGKLTVPVPEGVAQVPSPRQNVEDDAPVPPFKTPTGTLVVGTK